ncbi:hypothetical protein N9Y26_00855 [bacterium]|nr:hypothetical protein [bacterium]
MAWLLNIQENKTILKGKASAHYSLSKGTSRQKYPKEHRGGLSKLKFMPVVVVKVVV